MNCEENVCCENKEACTVINQYYGCCDGEGGTGGTIELVANLEETEIGKALDATMGKVLDDKIVDVNDNLSKSMNQFDLIANKVSFPSTAAISVTLNMSDYKYLLVQLMRSTYPNHVFGQEYIPVAIFKELTSEIWQIRRYLGNDYLIDVRYLDDTTISLTTNVINNVQARIYGIK